MVKKRKIITNKKFLYGDFDKDKIKNIDDRYPYKKARNKKIHRMNPELKLSSELRNIEKTHNKGKKIQKAIVGRRKKEFKQKKYRDDFR